MIRLGHSYIDVLKVDIEGDEWDIFDDLFNNNINSNNLSPTELIKKPLFGQLLIELHYVSIGI